jgi:hypothetical protein
LLRGDGVLVLVFELQHEITQYLMVVVMVMKMVMAMVLVFYRVRSPAQLDR